MKAQHAALERPPAQPAEATPPPATSDLLDYAQAARRLGVPVGTLRSLVSRHQIPHVRLSPRIVRFDPDELASWIAAKRVPAGGTQP